MIQTTILLLFMFPGKSNFSSNRESKIGTAQCEKLFPAIKTEVEFYGLLQTSSSFPDWCNLLETQAAKTVNCFQVLPVLSYSLSGVVMLIGHCTILLLINFFFFVLVVINMLMKVLV